MKEIKIGSSLLNSDWLKKIGNFQKQELKIHAKLAKKKPKGKKFGG